MIHTPTTRDTITNFLDTGTIEEDDELQLFCFYFAALTSLSDDGVQLAFGQARRTLLARYDLAIKHALTRSQFLNTQELKVLQALVLYLVNSFESTLPDYTYMDRYACDMKMPQCPM